MLFQFFTLILHLLLDSTIIKNDPYYKTINIDSIQDEEYFLGNIKYYA